MFPRGTGMRLVAASICALGAFSGCGKSSPAIVPAQAKPDLQTMIVHAQTQRSEQVWDGVVEAVNKATVSAQTSGRVVELPYDVNDLVEKDAVIVRFTDVEQKSSSNRARAQIAAAQATYDEAESSYQRLVEIFERKLVAKAQLDQERARRDAAKAALQSTQAQLREIGQQLDYTTVRAPYSGILTERHVQVGEAVQPGQALVSGVSLKDLRVTVQVPQSAIAAIRTFSHADVLLDGALERRVTASKLTIFPYADPATHTFNVRLELPGDDSGLFPGMTVKVAFANGEESRLMLPLSALVRRGELQGVYVVGNSGVVLRQVRTGLRQHEHIEILAGLAEGERIAVDPLAATRWLIEYRRGAPP